MSTEAVIPMSCAGERLVGVLHRPDTPGDVGVVIVVGGPQYRAGSHRQFTLLARDLARHGHAVLRFDARGMGDSGGDYPGFEHLGPDIAAAVDALHAAIPGLRGVVLWGLCDAASAALMYAHRDRRVLGMVLLNPWVRSEATLARTYLRHYYVARLFSRDFWAKLLSGRLATGRVLGDLAGNVRSGTTSAPAAGGFVAQMREGLASYAGPVLIVLSGNDYTAAEFTSVAEGPEWQRALGRSGVTRHTIASANHTFSTAAWREDVAGYTLRFVQALGADAAGNRT
jgi:exosortase A-associated hydrolase 1